MGHVVIEGVSKTFDVRAGTPPAVQNLDLEIRDGEFMTLVGPSGCGKTTTLRMIAGLETPTAGRILIDGKDMTDVPPQKRGLSMVFQNYAIFPHMTVRQNIGYGLRIAKMPKPERNVQVKEAADLVGIGDYLDRYPRQLSGGQRQRVALARALARKPEIILFDEPLSNLDAKLRDETRAQLKLLHRQVGATMIYVTHDQLEALTLSDKVAVMRNGSLEQAGPPLEVFNHPNRLSVASFVGSPTMNVFAGRMESGGATSTAVLDQGFQVELKPSADGPSGPTGDPRRIVLGIRPQHLQVLIDTPQPDGPRWRVDVVEPIGTESLLHLSLHDAKAVAVVASTRQLHEGDLVELMFPADQVHLFDEHTGAALPR